MAVPALAVLRVSRHLVAELLRFLTPKPCEYNSEHQHHSHYHMGLASSGKAPFELTQCLHCTEGQRPQAGVVALQASLDEIPLQE